MTLHYAGGAEVSSLPPYQPGRMSPRDRILHIERIKSQLETERASFLSLWKDLSDFIEPYRSRFLVSDVNRQGRRSSKIIDSTGTLASRTLAAGMMAGTTPPSRPWFRLTVRDPVLAESSGAKIWLDTVTQRMRALFLKTNLYQMLPVFYRDLGTFGTAAILVEGDEDSVMRFSIMANGSYYVANDSRLKSSVLIRVFRMTVAQVIEKFAATPEGKIKWSVVSGRIRNLYESGQLQSWVDVTHVVMKNDAFDPRIEDARRKRYISLYYESGYTGTGRDGDLFLRESGYDFFPMLVGRWEVTAEDTYGTNCPGITALGDVKQLQMMEKRKLQAIELIVSPPMKGGMELRNVKASILPGDLTITSEREGQRGFSPIFQIDPRLTELTATEQEVRSRINRAYFVDLFLMLASSDRRQITAREIEERHEEKLLAVGSVLEQLNQDVLDPLIDMAFAFMLRDGLIPDAPDELQGQDLKVEYVSILAQAQKVAGLAGIDRFSSYVAQLAQLNPEALDKVHVDKLVDEYADITGVPQTIIRDQEEVEQIRAARAQQQQAMQQAAMAQQAVAGVKNLSESSTERGSALSALLEASGAGNLVQ